MDGYDESYYDSEEFLAKERESLELEEKTLRGEVANVTMAYPGLKSYQVLEFKRAIDEAGGIENIDILEALKPYLSEEYIRNHYSIYIHDDSDCC